MGETIAILSGNGGAGKTTAAAGIGYALSKLGRSVLIVDLSAGHGDLELFFNYKEAAVYHYLDVLEGNCRISEAFIRIGDLSLYALPAPKNREFPPSFRRKIIKLLSMLKQEFDTVLLDVPVAEARFFGGYGVADRRIFLSTASAPSVRACKKLSEKLGHQENAMLILNRLPIKLLKEGRLKSPEEIVEETGLNLLGIVPEDLKVMLLPEELPFEDALTGLAGKAFYNISRRLSGEVVPIAVKGGRTKEFRVK